jgi:hypothetical protein
MLDGICPSSNYCGRTTISRLSKACEFVVMAKRKDTPEARLQRLAKALKERKPIDEIAEAFGIGEKLSERAAWENDALHEAQMRSLQEIDPDFTTKMDGPVQQAFDAFGLSPENPSDWRSLVTYFAYIHFGSPTKSPGRPSKWTGDRLCQLLFDFSAGQTANPNLTNTKIFERMIKDKSLRHRYGNETTDALKDAYRKAKNPVANQRLLQLQEAIQATIWSSMREAAKRAKIDLPDEKIRPLVPKLAMNQAFELIENHWPSIQKALKN